MEEFVEEFVEEFANVNLQYRFPWYPLKNSLKLPDNRSWEKLPLNLREA